MFLGVLGRQDWYLADQGDVSCPDGTAAVSVSLATLEARNDTECAVCAHI